MIIAINGNPIDKQNEQKIKQELIEQGYNIISLFEIKSKDEIKSLIKNSDILLILNESGYIDKNTTNEIFFALNNEKKVIFLNDYFLIRSEIINRLKEENIIDVEEFIIFGDIIKELINNNTIEQIINTIIIKIKQNQNIIES